MGLISHCPASFHSKLYSHHLPIRPILYRKFQTLHLAQQPDRSQRQPHRANQKSYNQQNHTILRGIGNKHSHAKQSNYRAEQTKHQTGYVDQPHAELDKKRQHQNDRCSYNHQQTFQKQADCQASLWVPVDQKYFLSGLCQTYSQVRTGCCFANASPLPLRSVLNMCHWHIAPFLVVLFPLRPFFDPIFAGCPIFNLKIE